MVNSVSQTPINTKTTKTSIFYVNDVHANIANMERLKTASDEFDVFVSSEKTDKLKFSAGDFNLGTDSKLNNLAVTSQNIMGLMAGSGGNHEFDISKKELVEILKNNNYKILGINILIPEDTKENKDIKNEVATSYIQEQNGTKYGIIGLFPFDFNFHVTDAKEYADFKTLTMEETIPLLKKELHLSKCVMKIRQNLKKHGKLWMLTTVNL